MQKVILLLIVIITVTALNFGVELPEDIEWQTNTKEPYIGDPEAKKGGTFYDFLPSYPLTFRLMGPNSNGMFANWLRPFAMENFMLVDMHPITDEWVPVMATHWYIADDNKTVYYRLDKDARWSDGEKIMADDFVFTWEMMKSPYTVDPFYKNYAEEYFESVDKIDDYTIRIVGTKESWKPLENYNLWPMPKHATDLGPDWVKEANNKFPVVPGPYVITETETGKTVVFSRIKNWWGEEKRYFKGLYNPDRIEIRILSQDQALDYFKKGELSAYRVNISKIWSTDTDFEAIKKGWVEKKMVFLDFPQGMVGLHMNLEAPIFQNKDFRKALQYLFPFETLNKELMYDAYYRKVTFFSGTPYDHLNLTPYGFNPKKAREHLIKAGYKKRGNDGILVNDKGERASFTIIYGSKSFTRHLTVIQQVFKRAGVEMNLKLLEGATAFERGLERKYEMTYTGRTAGFFPEPYQYFHTKFKESTNNNNIWGFGSPETDKLIETYMHDMDKQKRLEAMWKLEEIIHDEAFFIPSWDAPYMRILYWDYVEWPDFYLPRRARGYIEWQTFWIDTEKQKRLEQAMKEGKPLPKDEKVEEDPWGVKKAMEEKLGETQVP